MTGKPLAGRLPIGRLGFYVVCILLVGAMWLINRNIDARPYVLEESQLSPESQLSKSVDAYQAMNNLLITLATGILGAMGYLLINRPKQRYRLVDMWPAILSAVFVILSLYFAYLSYFGLEFALRYSVALDSDVVNTPRLMQFNALLLAVIFFADFVMQHLSKAD
jgi:hypothetical protein